MAEKCSTEVNVEGIKALETLKRKFGTNTSGLFSTLSKVTESWKDGMFKPSKQFTEWFKETHNGETPDFNNNTGGRMTKAIEKFVRLGDINVASTSRKHKTLNQFAELYTDSYARIFGIQTVVGFLNDFRYQDIYSSKGEDPTKGMSDADFQNRYANAVQARLKKILMTRIVETHDGMTINSLKTQLRGLDVDGVLNKLHDLIGGDDASYQDQNLFALVSEFTKNKNFLDDVLRDGKVNWFKKRYNDDELELNRQDDAETNGDANALDGQEQAKMMADSDGQELANPNSEVDVDLKIRLSSIKKLNSTSALTGQLDYDTDNPLGIPARLDVNQTINTLRYILAGVNNMDEAINRIKSVASVIPDRASYSIIADWMENDSNFANRLWNQLASPIVSKAIFTVQDGEAESRTSNARANNVEALFADFSNSTRNAVTSIVDNAHAKAIIEGNADWLLRQTSSDNVYQLINDVMTKDPNEILNSGTDFARANVLLHNFADSIRTYLPNISEAAVINYIKFNKGNKVKGRENEPDWANNVLRLKGLMSEIANGVQKSAEIKANNELEADFAHRQNYALEQKLGKVAAKRNENYIDEAAIRHRDFMSPTLYSNIASLAKEFGNYMITDINITSMNANRKQTSDAIDNSKVTEIMRVVGNHEVLAQYAPLIQKIAHSRYSTILIEHDGLFGLFRQTDKGLVPTDYAEQLIHTSLFNGIQDRDNGETSVYNQMVTADYVATGYTSFFHPNETQFQRDLENKGRITFGAYFMRTPADAPKQFMHTAPRYRYNDSNVGELFTIANKDEVDSIINNRINAVKSYRYESGDYPKGVIDTDDMTLHFNSDQTAIIYGGRNKNFDIRLENKQILTLGSKGIKNGNEVKMLATNDTTKRFKVSDDFIVSGILDVKNKRLTHIKLVGIDSGYISPHLEHTLRKKFLKDAENDKDKNGKPLVQRSININHPIYKAYRSAFLGELREAATAMQKFFELDDKGKVVYYTGLTDKYIKVNGKYMTETDYNHSIDEYNKKHTRKKAYAKDEELVDLNGQPVAKGGWNYEDDGTGKTKIVYHPEAALDLDDQLATGAYDIYHVGKSGKVLENGELTGRVFTSDKFELAERNYGNEVMQRYFNPFYRGADAYDSANRFVKLNPDGSVELTDKQEDAIQDMINNYVTDYVNQSLDRFDKYKQFVIDDKIPVDFEHVAEAQTNYNIAFYNYNDLYEGNTKFYKNSQDLLKRAKEAQAGGKPYAMGDFLTPSYLLTRSDDGEIYSGIHLNADGTTEDIHIPMRKKFNAITINNVVRTDPNVEKELIAQMKEASPDLDPKIAEAIIKSAHKDVKRNDAQSFITFEEWIRRIAGRGQLKRFKPLIDAIYDESKPVNAALINEFIQPMKNVYYDTYYDEQAGIMVPRFVKNAEFVLIPRFIKGTQFESVYKMMKDNDIDQLNTRETTKAGKHNVLTLWDNDGNMPDFTSAKPKDVAARKKFYAQVQGAKEEYDYRYLYTQQEPVQHINTDNKISVQIVKKIIDNIDKNSPLAGIKDDFFNVYTHKIKRSFENLMDEFNIKRDDDGHIIVNEQGIIEGVDYTELLNRLQEEALRNGLDSNLIDYFTQAPDDFFNAAANETGFKGLNTLMPLYDSATSVKTQSVVNAVFNSAITRQKINGFHGTQITNIGFQAKGENVKKSKWLHYHQDKDHPYMEIAMTYKAFGVDVNNAHYKKLRQIADAEAANTNTDKTGKEIFDEMIIDELTKDGLDKVVAYRIPTEGKQSMAVAKIAHFLDDTYGSTVVVPDEWVAQTGSDFDIDSVYGIQHKSYYDADGRLRRYEYKTEFDRKDYNKYAYNKFVKKLAKAAHISKDEARKRLAEQGIYSNSEVNDIAFENTKLPQNQKYDTAQMHAQVAYKALSNADKEFVKEINRDFQRIAEEKQTSNRVLSSSELFVNRLRYIKYKFNNYLNSNAKIDDARIASINEYLESNDELIDAVKSSTEFDSRFNENKETLIESNNAAIDKYAAENGIESETDYIGMSTYDKNEDYALDNKMVDDMLEILQQPASREENLSSSTFANITGDDGALQHVLAVMTPENKAALHRTNRSAYNFLDQADMMNDAIGGAKLKAFSVTRDTFCSVCNTVHPYLNKNDVIKINYNTDRLNKGEITHDSVGWFSHADKNTNRNIVGYLLTPYSSQTSAHAFDAVKEGAIPNVNEYTFATYKLFPEIGSDYDTAVSFIMQPGISRIVDAYERSKSVFSTDNRNPIYEAVKSIAIDLGIKTINVGGTELETEKAPINTVVEALQTTYGEQFKKVLGGGKISLKDNAAIKDVALNVKMQFRRFQRNLDDVDAQTRTNLLLWDLGQILQFNRLNSIATRITNLARVCNPDKFGAKQSIFTTNKVFRDIDKLIDEGQGDVLRVKREGEEVYTYTDEKGKTHTIDDMPFLEAIYPGISGGIQSFLRGKHIPHSAIFSRYSTLNSFLLMATGSSIEVARPLYKTESKEFRDLVYGIENVFDNTRNTSLDESTYYDFSKYILGNYYRANPFIAEPQYSIMDADGNHEHFGFDKSDPRVYETVIYPDPVTGKPITEQRLRNPEDLRYRETRRIYGYGHGANITATYKIKVKGDDGKLHDVERQEPLYIKDINHPTKDEFDKFVVLSPAQKVRWIQEHTTEDNLFKHLSAELDRSSRATRHGQQTITLNSDDVDTEIIRDMFEAAIFNNNPIISDAAMDLIKYSYLVEGRKMQRGGITDIIRNTALYNTLGDRNSRSIIQMLDTQIEISPDKTSAEAGKLYEDYIRSHSQMSQIAKHTIDKINNVPELTIGDQYFIVVDGDKMSAKSGILEKYSLAKYKHDAISGRDIPEFNHYVRLRNKGSRNEILYKIVPSKNGDTLYLMPLNKLETNEHGEFSANSENNKFPSQDYYYQLIEYKEAEALKVPGPMKPSIKDFMGPQTKDFITRKVRDFDWNKPTDDNVRTESKLFPPIIEDIDRQLGDGKKDVCYVTARALNKYFDYADKGQASLQVVYNKERDKNGSPVEKDGKPVNRGYYFVRVQRLPMDVVSKINDSLAKHNVLSNELKMYQGAVDAAKKYGLKNVSDVYKVVRHKDTKDELTYQSSVDEVLPEDDVKNSASDVPNKDKVTEEVSFGIQKQKEIESNQMMWNAIMHSDSDPITIRLRKELNAHNVTRDVSSIEANTSLIAHVGAKFAEAKRQKLNEISQNFPLPNGHIVSMTSKELFDVMEKDTDVRDKYLSIIGEALQFVKDMQIYYDLNITSMDEQDAVNYKKIQDAVQDISSNSILQNGYQIFADNYLKRKSTNPLVQDDIITMTDGTFSETFLGGMIEDVQHNGNPIVQTVTKIITDDIATKDLLAIKRVKEFNTKLDAIVQEARNNNESCTWDDVIDENNRLRTRYNNQYVTDYNNLQKTLNAAKAEHGEFSIEALRAQLAMDKWLTANTHREIIDLTSDEYFNQAKEQFFKERDEFNSVSQQQWIDNKVKELKDKLSDEDKKKFNEVTEKLWRASLRGQYADRKEFYSTPDDELRNILLTRKGYYEQLNDLTEDAINRAPEAFSKYKELTTKRNRLYAERVNGLLNENIERQIDALDAEIKRLTSLNTVDPATGDLISKREYDEENPYSKDPKVAYRQRIESLNSATIINDYIKKTKELRNQFYTEETDEKFKKDLDERLAIINKYEQRNGDGKLIISRVELAAKHKDYADALQWMHRNTRKEIKSAEDIQQEIAHRTPEEIEQQIIQGTSHIKLTNDERHYVDDDGTLYNRVTSVIQSPWERFPEDSPWKTPSTTVGTGVDTFLRDFFDDNLGDINTLAERYPNATQEDWMKLYNDLQPIKKIMKEKHLKAIPKDVTLKGQVIVKDRNGKKYKLNVAGTLDLLLYDKDGNFYIYDFKTHHVSNKPGAKPQPLDSNIGKMVRYSKQVSLYKQFLENEYHIKVKTLALMPIRVHYPDPKGFGEGITEYEAKGEDKTRRQLYANGKEFREANPILEKSIPINFTDVKVRYEDLPEEVRKEAKEFTEEDELAAPDFDLKAELTKAFETLRGSKSDRKFYKDILNLHPDIRDEYGNIDARKLSDVEIAKIKSYQERNLTTRENNVAFTDRTIINSAPNADEYYTGEFYEGLRVGGISNPEYREIVAKFNKLVQPYYDNTTHRLLTSRMTIDELKQMKDYLDQLDGTKSKYGVNKEAIERAQKFRKENVETKTNRKAYDEEERNAKLKGSDYYYAWLDANGIYSQAWRSYIPNDRLYGYFVPKESVKEKFIDKKRTRAAKLINKYYETTTSPYFNMKWNEVAAEAKGDTKKVQDWYEKNTVYNPRTHEREPLMCWRTMELKDDVATTYTPKGDYVHRKVRDKFVDHNFHGFGAARLGDNYKDDGSHRYQSKHKFNASQLKLIDFIQHEVLDKYTGLNRDADELTYNQAQRFAMKGQMPIEISQEAAKSMHSKGNRLKDATAEAGRALGDFLAIRGMKDIPNTQPQLSYYMRPAAMPMTELLKTKNSIVKQPIRPERANYQDGEIGDREYRADMNNYIEEVQERQRINLAENAKIASKDWRAVLGDFITKATHHNAIMDNRQMLWYLVQMTSRDNVYDRNSATLKFKRDNRLSTEGHPKYVMTNDENTRKQVETWFRRMYLDEWKEPTSQRLNRLAMYLQNFTSSTYMMLNIKGGIENVTTGLVNIGMEAFAQDYLGFKDFALASGEYSIGIPDYIKHMFDGKADTLQGAIIKTFNVVDFERMNNLETNSDYKGIIETLRDWAYSPQSMGEHYMQNTVLFAMLKSHRLILDPKTNGYRYMNMAEYTRDSAMIAMKEYLDELSKTTGEDEYQKLIDVVEKIKADPNVLSKYVWFRRDLISDYATFKLTPEQQKGFLAKYDEIKNKAEETFTDDENHPTFYSQLELGEDGELHFKAGSKMAELDRISEKPGQPSEAMKLMGAFKNRVIFTNKKIHGVYDKLGGAQIEKYVWGSLVMQYHKHLYPGIMKHWRRQGYYNEVRGTIEKGCYTALLDFLAIPFDKVKFDRQLSDEDVSAWQGFQNILKSSFDYLRNIKTCWNLLPDYERANIRRNLGDMSGLFASFFAIFALRMFQDNTSTDNFAFNLAMYEFDKLQMNSTMYTPWMAQTEFRTQWSSPIAAQSIVEDLTRTIGELAALAIEGDSYDGYYHSGIYSGQFRPAVYLQRRLPIYRQYYTMSTLNKNNKAYHIGDNTLGFFGADPKEIAESIRGVELDN